MERNKRIENPVIKTSRKISVSKREIIRDLKEKGFRHIKQYPDLFINESGKVYSMTAGKELKVCRRNTISIGAGKRISVPRLVLYVFRDEPIREKSHIKYLDGNTANITPTNVEYIRKYENTFKNEVNPESLYTAIRCYYEVPKRYKVKDYILTRMYLARILKERRFYDANYIRAGIDVFENYMKGEVNNVKNVAKEHGINFKDVQIIVNDFLNRLINGIFADIEAGKLQIKDFQPRPKTKTQKLRETNEQLLKMGLEPLPLRKKSTKELIRDFRKRYTENLNK